MPASHGIIALVLAAHDGGRDADQPARRGGRFVGGMAHAECAGDGDRAGSAGPADALP